MKCDEADPAKLNQFVIAPLELVAALRLKQGIALAKPVSQPYCFGYDRVGLSGAGRSVQDKVSRRRPGKNRFRVLLCPGLRTILPTRQVGAEPIDVLRLVSKSEADEPATHF